MMCLNCGAWDVGTSYEEAPIQYGIAPYDVVLYAVVPVRSCPHCGFSYTDDEGEDARSAAVLDYLAFTPFAAWVAAWGYAHA